MPHYYAHKKPTLPQTPWTSNSNNSASQSAGPSASSSGGGMNVSILLDQQIQPGNVSFTNLDQVSGRVVVRCPKDVAVDNIIVKLEGESRTRLLSPASSGDKQRPQLEYHKILYKVAQVYPPTDVAQNRANIGTGKNASSLAAGSHEFPFSFKLPFNTSCVHEMTKSPSMSMTGSGIEIAKPPPGHVKKTLPPTLSGFPGEAEIRYYLKATITRHYFWQESIRAIVPFNFFPIEPPRSAPLDTELYARQTHAFNQLMTVDGTKSKVRAFFSKATDSSIPGKADQSPTVTVDARLPEPAILTCNEDVPLRILVKKANDFFGMLHLQSLQVALVGTTKIRAHEAHRIESSDWIIISKSNLGIPIGAASDPAGTETVIDERYWRGQILPNTVAPSFVTCNIQRSYHLDVRIGLSYSDATTQATSKVRSGAVSRTPQTVMLPLKLDLEVFSGIAPPQELLDAMAKAEEDKLNLRRRSTQGSTTGSTGSARQRKASAAHVPHVTANFPAQSQEAADAGSAAHPPNYADAPPSYEDAIGSRLPPVDGSHRPQYAPPLAEEDDLLRGDEKARLRRDS